MRRLGFGALAPHLRIAPALLGHRHLPANLLHTLALLGYKPRQLTALRLGGGAGIVRGVAGALGFRHARFALGGLGAQFVDPPFQTLQFVLPGLHLACGEGDLHRVAASAQFGVALGAAALAGQRADLGGHLADQIVQALQVDRRLLQAALGGAAPVAVQPDAGRFLEEFAPVVGTVGEQGVDHLALDHDAGVRTEPRAAQQIVNVPQPAGRAVEQVVALTRPRQAPGDHDLAEGNGEAAVGVVEMERDLGHVHGPAGRRTLEDDLFHLGAAQQAGPLFAEYPTHGVGDVGLAAPVRPDDGRDALIEGQRGLVGKRLEALHFQLGQPH